MKTKITLFLMMCTSIVFAQTPLNWSSITQVGGNGFGNIRPKITVTDDNLPLIIFGNSDSAAIFKVKGNGSIFSAPQRITPKNVNAVTMDWQGPEMSSYGNDAFIVFKSSPETDQPIYTVKSSDAGQTFQGIVQVDDIGGDVSRFPCIDVLPNGNPVVAFMRFDAGFNSPRYVSSNSLNGGQSYQLDVNASTNIFAGEACDCCPGNITVNNNVQVVSYRNNDNNIRDIKSVLSFDSGNAYPSGIAVDHNNWYINQCPSTGPDVVLTGDSMVTVWKSGSSPQRIWVSCANINNSVIGTYGMLHNNGTVQNFPHIAGNGDTLGVVWEEKSIGQTYIKFTYSVSGAKGLFQNTAIISTSLVNQAKPEIAFRNGTFHVIWSDNSGNKCSYRKASVPNSTFINKNETESVHIYPSPFTNNFTVSSSLNIFSTELSDISGRIIMSQNFKNKNEIQFSTEKIDAGVYILTLTDVNNKKIIRRIVKK